MLLAEHEVSLLPYPQLLCQALSKFINSALLQFTQLYERVLTKDSCEYLRPNSVHTLLMKSFQETLRRCSVEQVYRAGKC